MEMNNLVINMEINPNTQKKKKQFQTEHKKRKKIKPILDRT